MQTTIAELRRKLKEYCNIAVSKRRPIRVRRGGGGDIVLLSAQEYDTLCTTTHLLSSPKNAARLHEALERARS